VIDKKQQEVMMRETLKDFKESSKGKDLQMKIDLLMAQALVLVQSLSPYRSGDLSRSFQARIVDGGLEIFTNMEYMPYTVGKWVSPQWRGRANPNEGWFKEAAEYIARYIALGLGGTYVSN
jgi:hypothetical protein